MVYTIIEVERATNIPSRKIRFWLDKGLFPFVERDENGGGGVILQKVIWSG
ncbi:MerR family DNA-binding transcriptional regulator [Helicobacter bilis]|uniref:MerR family DNA-binding transcriptional regulator n=1 Tax=Helicobacter bilis TaxID=37372 RepID=UPI0022797AAC|nr:MerR family DNA-binding transcriptional regulator [Helicobacter bilis]